MTRDPEPQVPDPNGPPVATKQFIRGALSVGFLVVFGGAAAFLVLAAVPSRTMGALRSQRIKWQERRQEIAQAQSAAAETEAEAAQPGEPGHD